MFNSKHIKITVPAAVIAAFIVLPLTINVYANNSKLTLQSAKGDTRQPDKAISYSAEAIFYSEENYTDWLKEQKSYNIVGDTWYIGQKATIITGKLGEQSAKKYQSTDFKMWADVATGEILDIAVSNLNDTVPRGLKPTVPHPPKNTQTVPEVKETLLQVKNGDDEFDKQIRVASVYVAPIAGGKQVDVVSGHFKNYYETSYIDDPQDGVITVHIHSQSSMVNESSYTVYHTPTKHGELKILSVKDKTIFTIVAADGTKFIFDLNSRTFKQVQ